MLATSASCSSAKRNQNAARWVSAARISRFEAERAAARHSCARRRYSSALPRVTAVVPICPLVSPRGSRRHLPRPTCRCPSGSYPVNGEQSQNPTKPREQFLLGQDNFRQEMRTDANPVAVRSTARFLRRQGCSASLLAHGWPAADRFGTSCDLNCPVCDGYHKMSDLGYGLKNMSPRATGVDDRKRSS
jgi:hypothetical protein